ncbi:helix-turn-helix domain-containing protein [Pseudomonas fluorescens]|uniref:helix-turn-helix domain-containing protein n=1 Tax=Pseudomonas fluorescens TaxID=294 RepID=UPI003D3158AB
MSENNLTLEESAPAAGMPRTALSAHFENVSGVAPIDNLTHWRMRLAKTSLPESKIPLIEIAGRFGYSSKNAFSNAFKRVTGLAPGLYREATSHRD